MADAPTIKPTILMFEFGVGGHFPNYLRMLIGHWHEHGFGHLHIVATRQMVNSHPSAFDGLPSPTITYSLLDVDEDAMMIESRRYSCGYGDQPADLIQRHGSISSFYWGLIKKHGSIYPARHILLMNLDEYLIALSAGERAPTDFSGIFFRPGFQYRNVDDPVRMDAFGAIQERLVMERLLKHPQLRAAFLLDRTVANRLAGIGSAEAILLPDPVRLPQALPSSADQAAAKSELGVEPERHVLLLFGDIAPRKGLSRLLNALQRFSAEEQRRVCLAIVGNSAPEYEDRLMPLCDAFAKATSVQVIRRRAYIDDAEMERWFAAATVVVATYMRHVGMSGVLLLAAAHGRPVLSQAFGVMGQMTRDHGLGLTANPANADELAEGIRAFLGPTPPTAWNPDRAAAMIREHSHEKFGETLFGALRRFIG